MKVRFLKRSAVDGQEHVNGHVAEVQDDVGNQLIKDGAAVKAPDTAGVTVFGRTPKQFVPKPAATPAPTAGK